MMEKWTGHAKVAHVSCVKLWEALFSMPYEISPDAKPTGLLLLATMQLTLLDIFVGAEKSAHFTACGECQQRCHLYRV
jgi:hypothetical protein